jgi:hypothetical protein
MYVTQQLRSQESQVPFKSGQAYLAPAAALCYDDHISDDVTSCKFTSQMMLQAASSHLR